MFFCLSVLFVYRVSFVFLFLCLSGVLSLGLICVCLFRICFCVWRLVCCCCCRLLLLFVVDVLCVYVFIWFSVLLRAPFCAMCSSLFVYVVVFVLMCDLCLGVWFVFLFVL